MARARVLHRQILPTSRVTNLRSKCDFPLGCFVPGHWVQLLLCPICLLVCGDGPLYSICRNAVLLLLLEPLDLCFNRARPIDRSFPRRHENSPRRRSHLLCHSPRHPRRYWLLPRHGYHHAHHVLLFVLRPRISPRCRRGDKLRRCGP